MEPLTVAAPEPLAVAAPEPVAVEAPEPVAVEAPLVEAALLDLAETCDGPDVAEPEPEPEPLTVATPEPAPEPLTVEAPELVAAEAALLDAAEGCDGPDAVESAPEPLTVEAPEPVAAEAALLDAAEDAAGPDVAAPEPTPVEAPAAVGAAALLDVAEACEGPDREFEVGDRVEARFQGKAKYYAGTIEALAKGGYDVAYDDGDRERSVAEALVRRAFAEPCSIEGAVEEDEFDYDFEPMEEFGSFSRRLGPEAYVELAVGGAPKAEVVALLVRDGLCENEEAACAFLDAQDVYDVNEVLSGPLDAWQGDHVEACWPVILPSAEVYVGGAAPRLEGGVLKRDACARNYGDAARRVTIGGVATSSVGGATPLKIKCFNQTDPPSFLQMTQEEATSSTLYDEEAFAVSAPTGAWQPPGAAGDDGDDVYQFRDGAAEATARPAVFPPTDPTSPQFKDEQFAQQRPDLDLDDMIADFEEESVSDGGGDYSDSFEDN